MWLAETLHGKPEPIDLSLVCLLAGGHLLIEDVPGVGKTTLAQGLARVFALDFTRIQFTSDLLPGDIVGVSVFDSHRTAFVFRRGPLFHRLVLADEINRASPRTQSALLEAMAEGQVTVEGATHVLEKPFHVIATQNPVDRSGTFDLPDSQLDRFLMRIHIGYPPADAERRLLAAAGRPADPTLVAVADPAQLIAWQQAVADVALAPPLIDYLLALIVRTRTDNAFATGLSPRAGIALRRAAQAAAWLAGRDHVTPEDVQTVLPAVVDHRLHLAADDGLASARLLAAVDLP
ncbi:MoxR family ATPase [Salinisphaera sp. Q1T1-3]|uniref:AAA family ATPase n=1 Tax=Salinisphaera sp. Q1T1-3 TaxID=2321229 RepID=UPI000E7412DF|nr:AAA family ATPase [Salinisphaera sp. Q1T1-3]